MKQEYAVIYSSRIVDDKSYVRIQYFDTLIEAIEWLQDCPEVIALDIMKTVR